MARLDIRVVPRSSRDAIDGTRDGRLVVRVTAPPVDDAANEAVVRLIAGTLGVARRDVRIVSGATARNKSVDVATLSGEEIARRLGS